MTQMLICSVVAAKKTQYLAIAPSSTTCVRAGERGIDRSTSSPPPSPPSNGGEGDTRKLPTTSNRTNLVESAAVWKREDLRRAHFRQTCHSRRRSLLLVTSLGSAPSGCDGGMRDVEVCVRGDLNDV